jgi:hypothetical protein
LSGRSTGRSMSARTSAISEAPVVSVWRRDQRQGPSHNQNSVKRTTPSRPKPAATRSPAPQPHAPTEHVRGYVASVERFREEAAVGSDRLVRSTRHSSTPELARSGLGAQLFPVSASEEFGESLAVAKSRLPVNFEPFPFRVCLRGFWASWSSLPGEDVPACRSPSGRGFRDESRKARTWQAAATRRLEASRASGIGFGAERPGRRRGGRCRGWYPEPARRSGHREQGKRPARPDDPRREAGAAPARG